MGEKLTTNQLCALREVMRAQVLADRYARAGDSRAADVARVARERLAIVIGVHTGTDHRKVILTTELELSRQANEGAAWREANPGKLSELRA